MRAVRLAVAAVIACSLGVASAIAQTQGQTTPTGDAATPTMSQDPAPPPQPAHATDVGDLWHHLLNKPSSSADPQASANRPFFFVTPSVSVKPSTGLAVGVASSIVFVAGDPATTHISSGDWAVSDSVKKQAGTSIRFRIFTPENRWFIQGDDRLAWSSQTTYELGIDPEASGFRLKYDRTRINDTVFRRVRPRLLVGLGLNRDEHSNIRPANGSEEEFNDSAYVAYSIEHGFPTDRQVSGGMSFGMLFDNRDNSINASRGWLAGATYRTFFDGFLGGTSTWQVLDLDVRTYKALGSSKRQEIAVWFLGDFVTTGAAPYFDLPAIAEDTYGRSARGYTTGRYRGPHLAYGEIEYRTTLTRNRLLGAVVFANMTAVDSETSDQKLFATVAPAGGAGLRLLLSKRSRANLCLDYGWGTHGSSGLYLAMRETF
jgi:hypothetical protein